MGSSMVHVSLASYIFLIGLPSSLAFVCPPESLNAAPVGVPEGSECGGVCKSAGTCADGLVCEQQQEASNAFPKLPLLGAAPNGICTKKTYPMEVASKSATIKSNVVLKSPVNFLFL